MVRPAHFGPNAETAASNAFQNTINHPAALLEVAALAEFDNMARSLQLAGVRLIVIADTEKPDKPDAVFSNNWITTHRNGDVILFPLEAACRRAERRMDIIDTLSAKYGFTVRRIIDLSSHERDSRFLEGTGSMVLDRIHRIAFAAQSTRTHAELLPVFAKEAGYEVCAFDTRGGDGRSIYHTNVMLAIGTRFAVVCSAVIADKQQRDRVTARLVDTGRTIVDITTEQMMAFCGNMLEVQGESGEPLIVLSRTAYKVLTDEQRAKLQHCGKLLPVAVETIEEVGGGSVRCMLTEIFLPQAAS